MIPWCFLGDAPTGRKTAAGALVLVICGARSAAASWDETLLPLVQRLGAETLLAGAGWRNLSPKTRFSYKYYLLV